MAVKKVSSKDFAKVLRKDMRTLKKRTQGAVRETAKIGQVIAYNNAPIAFGKLAEGIVVQDLNRDDQGRLTGAYTGTRIRSTMPYSEAVEKGSRPHMPPIQAIYEWVKLRGTQALHTIGGMALEHPRSVHANIHAQGNEEAVPVDAAWKVAVAIAHSIAANGTKPTWWMKKSAAEIEDSILDGQIKEALEKDL